MFHHELFFKKTIHYNAYTTHELRAVLAKEKYDAVVELPADVDTFYTQIRNMIFFRMLGIKCGGGWCVSNTLFLKKWQLKELVFEREQERLKKILQQIGIRTHQEDYHSLYNASDLDFVKSSFLKAKNINSDKIIAIATGAKLERKKWPMERFKEVTFHLLEVGYQVFLIGDAKDAEETATWQHQLLVNLQGKLTIPQTAALLSHCKLLLCNDSGPMHLAYAAGAKVLALFSARNYRDKWYPPDGNKILVNYNVDCAICRKQMCSNNICMQLIEVSEVKKELDVLLSQV
jgi:ADP-heptose:LPS heptosyltransferase